MKWILSRYNHKIAYVKDYTDDLVLYDRSENRLNIKQAMDLGIKIDMKSVENKGSDIYDKFSWIIDNYDNLPDIALLSKANLFDFIKPREFEKIKDNTTFTPILSQEHHTYRPVCWYMDNIYCERNDYWYLNPHPAKYAKEIKDYFHMEERAYNAFAPGSNYILPRKNILRTSLGDYKQLRSCLEWAVYPGDAMLLERNLYYLWR